MRKRKYIILIFLLLTGLFSCFRNKNLTNPSASNLIISSKNVENIERAINIVDSTFYHYFQPEDMAMSRFYNPFTHIRSEETGSVWMYTAGIEAVNNILRALQLQKESGVSSLYEKYFDKYSDLLYKLYDNLDFYKGTFELTSYTQTKEWSIYGVHRSSAKNGAKVEGIENVYDDQMWLVRELLQSFNITQDNRFLEEAEYLTEYVLDGWDCTIDEDGNERGGIPWGPGYVSKHSCSNGPMISPLVWLHEYYSGKDEPVEYRYIDSKDGVTRISEQKNKSDYYLLFAKKIYDWQKKYLLREDGVYDDMMGGCTPRNPRIENINGTDYRVGILCKDRIGPALTYNSGTMISGASDLFRVTGESKYFADAKTLVDSSFSYFAKLNEEIPNHYSYKTDGFNNWFNGVLLRSYVDFYAHNEAVSKLIETFQDNLDYGYENYKQNGLLPHNLLTGWENNPEENNTEGMFMFAFAAGYAEIAGIK